MAYRRGRLRKKRYVSRRKIKYMRKRKFIKKAVKTYFFKRNVLRSAIVQTPTIDYMGVFQFSLSDVPNYTEFSALYDQYRINRIKIRFIPQYNMQQLAVPSSNTVVPKLFTVVDTNDANIPANINTLREFSTVKCTRGFSQAVRYFKPFVASAVYGGGFFTSYAVSSPYISTDSPNVAYYGIKYAIDAAGSGQTVLQKWDVECTYYMSFRKTK